MDPETTNTLCNVITHELHAPVVFASLAALAALPALLLADLLHSLCTAPARRKAQHLRQMREILRDLYQ